MFVGVVREWAGGCAVAIVVQNFLYQVFFFSSSVRG